jgi:cell division protease FtsH
MKLSWKTLLLWAIPVLVIGFFLWQGAFSPNVNTLGENTAKSRMTYGHFLELLENGKVARVDLFEGGRTAIVQASDPEINLGILRSRVDLPINAPELFPRLREANVTVDFHPARSDGAIWGFLGNLIFPVLLIGSLFFLFRRSNNMPGGPGQAMNFGKSRARFMMEAKTGVLLMMSQVLRKRRKNYRKLLLS